MLISIDEAVACLRRGDLVALPTETVYGLAGLALKEDSVKKIYRLKGRPSTNPLIVHVYDQFDGEKLAQFNDLAHKACKFFWPGPLTIVLPKKDCVPYSITGGGNTVALRSPSQPLFRKVLQKVDSALAAPSANPTNRTSPTQAKHVQELFGKKCPAILDGGECRHGVESTVLDLSEGEPRILRYGPITPEKIENVLERKIILPKNQEIESYEPKKSPGSFHLHYAPKTPLFIFRNWDEIRETTPSTDDLLILPEKLDLPNDLSGHFSTPLYLSQNGDLEEIARNLYNIMIEADKQGAKRILTLLPAQMNQLYLAVYDRLKRASKLPQ